MNQEETILLRRLWWKIQNLSQAGINSQVDYPNVLCRINMTQLDTCVKKTTRHNTTQTTHTKNIFSSCYRTRGVYTGI